MQKVNLAQESGIRSKGVHIFSFCEIKTEEAKKLSDNLDSYSGRRLGISFERDREMLPLQLKLSHLNVMLGQAPRKIPQLEIEQKTVIQRLKSLAALYQKKLDDLWQEYRYYTEKFESQFKTRELVVENITTTIGRAVLAQRLANDTTYTGIVNYTALGTNATAPVVGDATLGTETYRKALSSGVDASNVAYLETFFSASEVSGTFQEYGMFIDGTGSANSGQLFNRFTSAITKSGTETLNVQSIITLNDA